MEKCGVSMRALTQSDKDKERNDRLNDCISSLDDGLASLAETKKSISYAINKAPFPTAVEYAANIMNAFGALETQFMIEIQKLRLMIKED
jgi:hypothetical protein